MYQWLDRSHPQVLQSAVFLGYLMAFFCVMASGGGGFSYLFLLLGLGLAGGAFGTASNKRWGYFLFAACACIKAVMRLVILLFSVLGVAADPFAGSSFVGFLFALNAVVFPLALAAAVLHRHSREYQKIWFESGTLGQREP